MLSVSSVGLFCRSLSSVTSHLPLPRLGLYLSFQVYVVVHLDPFYLL